MGLNPQFPDPSLRIQFAYHILASTLPRGHTWSRGTYVDRLMDLDHREFATNVAKPLLLLVGLTRIELVTSSLSGMRSNQLSYSPESDSGTQILLALTLTLNRADNNLFFQHSHANAAHKIGDQVENGGRQNPEGGCQHHTQKSQDHDIDKQLAALEFK